MSSNLIPQDPTTRKLLARVLASMIKSDFDRARGRKMGLVGEAANQASDAETEGKHQTPEASDDCTGTH